MGNTERRMDLQGDEWTNERRDRLMASKKKRNGSRRKEKQGAERLNGMMTAKKKMMVKNRNDTNDTNVLLQLLNQSFRERRKVPAKASPSPTT